jgi:membrane fusion protein, multidrug efflux system
LPQEQLAQVHTGLTIRLNLDALPGQNFAGNVTAIDPLVDSASRNFQVEATVPNPEQRLMPGMFVRVAVLAGDAQKFLTLPQTSITYNPYGATVFLALAQPDGKHVAKQVFVTTGATRGDQTTILTGIKAGDAVVTSGQLKLKNGTPLEISAADLPSNAPNPTPQEH